MGHAVRAEHELQGLEEGVHAEVVAYVGLHDGDLPLGNGGALEEQPTDELLRELHVVGAHPSHELLQSDLVGGQGLASAPAELVHERVEELRLLDAFVVLEEGVEAVPHQREGGLRIFEAELDDVLEGFPGLVGELADEQDHTLQGGGVSAAAACQLEELAAAAGLFVLLELVRERRAHEREARVETTVSRSTSRGRRRGADRELRVCCGRRGERSLRSSVSVELAVHLAVVGAERHGVVRVWWGSASLPM